MWKFTIVKHNIENTAECESSLRNWLKKYSFVSKGFRESGQNILDRGL